METKIIEWIVNKDFKSYKPKKASYKNSHIRESKRLRYCKKCNMVWEIACTGKILSYDNMPTYKLERKTCRICVKKNER